MLSIQLMCLFGPSRTVFFDIDGCPVLDVTEEMDVKPEFRTVETVLVVKRNDCRFE